jgi:hypothetical protein
MANDDIVPLKRMLVENSKNLECGPQTLSSDHKKSSDCRLGNIALTISPSKFHLCHPILGLTLINTCTHYIINMNLLQQMFGLT